jgi:hypothetical protein
MITMKTRFETYKESEGFKTLQSLLDLALTNAGYEKNDLSTTKDFGDLYETLEGENEVWTPEIAAIASLIETMEEPNWTWDKIEEKQKSLVEVLTNFPHYIPNKGCLLYTSDAADDM